jgi:calcium-binding protein CML
MSASQTATRDELLRVFERFDANGDGLIDEEEFAEMLTSLGWDSPAELRSLEFAAIDSNGDGLAEFGEFADWWLDRN